MRISFNTGCTFHVHYPFAGHIGNMTPLSSSSATVTDIERRLNNRFASCQTDKVGQRSLTSLCSQIDQHVRSLPGAYLPEDGECDAVFSNTNCDLYCLPAAACGSHPTHVVCMGTLPSSLEGANGCLSGSTSIIVTIIGMCLPCQACLDCLASAMDSRGLQVPFLSGWNAVRGKGPISNQKCSPLLTSLLPWLC